MCGGNIALSRFRKRTRCMLLISLSTSAVSLTSRTQSARKCHIECDQSSSMRFFDSQKDTTSILQLFESSNDKAEVCRREVVKNFLISTSAAVLVSHRSVAEANDLNIGNNRITICNGKAKSERNSMRCEDDIIDSNQTVKGEKSEGLDWRYFVAGGGCASFSHGIATPFDVIKTKMQAEPEVYTDGMVGTANKLLNDDGPSVFLKGILPTVIGFGLEGAVKFGVYESLKPFMMSLFHAESDDNFFPYLASSVGAAAVASLMLIPMERARINVVTTGQKSGLLGGLGNLIQKNGLASIFSGYFTMLFKQVPYTMTKQVSFDIFTAQIYSIAILSFSASEEMRLFTTAVSAFLASILACTASQPGDVLLTKQLKENSTLSIIDITSSINGFKGYFVGYSARLAHVACIVTSQLVVYDSLKRLLGLPATGS